MNTCKHPISHALTSFNGETADTAKILKIKPGAKIHHLPASIWKKKEGEKKPILSKRILLPPMYLLWCW